MAVTGDVGIAEPVAVGTEEIIDFVLEHDPRPGRSFLERAYLEDFIESRQVLVAHAADRIAGVALTGHPKPMPSDWRVVRVLVDPSARGRGLGGALHRAARRLLPGSGIVLRSGAYDDDPRDLEIAQHWGFEVVQRSFESCFDLTDLPPLPPLPDAITIEDCSTLEFPDTAEVEAMYDRSQTNPERAQFIGDLAFLRSFAPPPLGLGALLRVHGAPVALTWAVKEPPAVHIAWTGVDPAFRGHGYGALLKQALHQMARDAGASECRTNNEEHNTGIRRVNAELGYRVEYGEYWLRQQL